MSILIALLIFGALIFIHELGHFLTARMFGVGILEFSIGMGPKLLSVRSKKSKTVYSLRLLPIGGYVSMYGEDEEISPEAPKEPIPDSESLAGIIEQPFAPEAAFSNKKVWQRMIICVAGAVMNLLLGFLIMTVITLRQDVYGTTTVAAFQIDDAYSEQCGLQVGDEILRINGHRVHISTELVYRILLDGAEPMEVQVRRNGQKEILQITLPSDPQNPTFPLLDFYVTPVTEKTAGTVLHQSFYGAKSQVTLVFESLKGLLTGKYGVSEMSGPIGITGELGNAAKADDNGMSLLSLVVLISINLGICNLLPIPALDGARLLFLLIEAVRRKPINPKYEGYIHLVGFALLMILFVIVAYQDILRLFAK